MLAFNMLLSLKLVMTILLKKKSFSQNWGFNNSARRNSYSKSSTRGGRKIRKTRKVRHHRKSKKSRTCKKK
jgi:hypothetical protein